MKYAVLFLISACCVLGADPQILSYTVETDSFKTLSKSVSVSGPDTTTTLAWQGQVKFSCLDPDGDLMRVGLSVNIGSDTFSVDSSWGAKLVSSGNNQRVYFRFGRAIKGWHDSANARVRLTLTDTAAASLPSWVPQNAWVWTDVPGTTFSNYMKEDGSGIAPASTADPFGSFQYNQEWGGYGGPCYSAKHHQFYLFGGGHAQTTLNALIRWNIGKNSPDMDLAAPPTLQSLRMSEYGTANYGNGRAYWSDGKPYCAHSYRMDQFVDAIDEWLQLGLTFANQPPGTNTYSNNATVGWSFASGTYRAAGYWPNVLSNIAQGIVFTTLDGAYVYYTVSGTTYRLNTATRAMATVGSVPTIDPNNRRAAHDGSNLALVLAGELDRGSAGPLYLNLTTGALTSCTITGDVPPSDGCFEVAWCPPKGYYLASFVPAAALQPPTVSGTLSSVNIYAITPTGPSTATSVLKTVTGTPPDQISGCRGMAWDNGLGCLVFCWAWNRNIKAIKVQ